MGYSRSDNYVDEILARDRNLKERAGRKTAGRGRSVRGVRRKRHDLKRAGGRRRPDADATAFINHHFFCCRTAAHTCPEMQGLVVGTALRELHARPMDGARYRTAGRAYSHSSIDGGADREMVEGDVARDIQKFSRRRRPDAEPVVRGVPKEVRVVLREQPC